ncbi:MAG: phage major capsid protein [Sulfuricella denitrificans]|nr:phage major capsid protein [Sulfuricella denitrificans]
MDKLKTGTLYRGFSVDRAAIDETARTVQLAFSSEEPYDRWFGTEILDHSPQSIRLGRLTNGGPLLLDHEPEDHIGVVESIAIGPDRVGRAVVRFGRSADAEEAFRDVMDGIRRHVSVGYLVHKMQMVESADNAEIYRVTDWEPLEISLVAIPADPTVGIGRSNESGSHETLVERQTHSKKEQAMSETIAATPAEPVDVSAIEKRARDEFAKTERDRVNEIIGIGEAYASHGAEKLASQYVREGKSVSDFRAAVMELMSKKNEESMTVDLSQKEVRQYSYARAIAAALDMVEGRNATGLEAEISADLEKSMPASYKRNGGLFVPLQLQRTAIATANYNTANKGAEGVFTEAGEFIDLLRNASAVVGRGARVLSGLQGPVSFPKQSGAGTAYWMAENDGTDVTASNLTLGSTSLSPKTLQASTAYSRQLLAQSVLDVEMLIREDMAATHALAWDLAALHGTGNSNQPQGIYAASNVNSVAMGGVPTFGKLIDMVTEVAKDNALMGSLGFLTTPGMAGKLSQTVKASGTDSTMIWTGNVTEGNLAGYNANATNQVSATLGGGSEHGLIFGNWSDLMIGMWGALEIVVDPYALKKQGMVEVTSFQMVDIALRHAESFCKATGATIA